MAAHAGSLTGAGGGAPTSADVPERHRPERDRHDDLLARHAQERDQGKRDQHAASGPRGRRRVFAPPQHEHGEQDDPCDPGEASEQADFGELMPVPVLRVVRRQPPPLRRRGELREKMSGTTRHRRQTTETRESSRSTPTHSGSGSTSPRRRCEPTRPTRPEASPTTARAGPTTPRSALARSATRPSSPGRGNRDLRERPAGGLTAAFGVERHEAERRDEHRRREGRP